MTDSTTTAATVVAPASAGPALTAKDFHPDHPGPTGWLIYDLHQRLSAVESKLGLTSSALAPAAPAPAAPSVTATVEADVVSAASKVESEASTAVHAVGTGLEEAVHLIEDALHIKHS